MGAEIVITVAVVISLICSIMSIGKTNIVTSGNVLLSVLLWLVLLTWLWVTR